MVPMVDGIALAVCSSLLGPLLIALTGLSASLGTMLASAMARTPGMPRNVTGLGLGENSDVGAIEYGWADLRSIGDIHMSSSDTRPRDSTSPGVLWHLPMATENSNADYRGDRLPAGEGDGGEGGGQSVDEI